MWFLRTKCAVITILTFLIHRGDALLPRIDPLVETKIGLISGLRATDGDYSMFMGIPYATVNESNPFGPSIPHPGFDTTFQAYYDSVLCPQKDLFSDAVLGSVDCLQLNVYVPNSANSKNLLPVMVWFHGGIFSVGSATKQVYGPRFLVKHDVILVTFNYRLGPYGFMCLGTTDIPGNQGLKDQLMALRWINNNINSFGGDPKKVTIFGESAGGALVDFQLIYGTENLFNKVIMQSGAALSPWAVLEPDTSAPIKLAEHLGLFTTDTNEALEYLAKSDPTLVITSTSELKLNFRPCVENAIDNVERFIHDYPANIENLNLGNMALLLGYNSDELLYTYESLTSEEYSTLNIFYNTLKVAFNLSNEDLIEMETQVRQFYVGDDEFSAEVKHGVIEFDSDFRFIHPIVRTMNHYLDNGMTNLYHYLFSYDGGRAFQKLRYNIKSEGVTHADELGYFFDIAFMNQQPSAEDQLVIDRVTTMWTNFAKYGKPIPEVTELLPLEWPAVTKSLMYYLNIDLELEVKKRNFNRRMAMWNLFYKINGKYPSYQDSFML